MSSRLEITRRVISRRPVLARTFVFWADAPLFTQRKNASPRKRVVVILIPAARSCSLWKVGDGGDASSRLTARLKAHRIKDEWQLKISHNAIRDVLGGFRKVG